MFNSPEQYEQLLEFLEDYVLFLQAERRMKNTEAADFLSAEEVMSSLGITESELEDVEVDIE